MLMMLGRLGFESPGQHQLMLMMLGGLGADVHDAQGFGLESPGQHQLMLMMLGGLGFESAGQHWVLKARASTSCGFESPGPAPADVHDARRGFEIRGFGF